MASGVLPEDPPTEAAVSFAAAVGEAFVTSGPVTSSTLRSPGALSIQAPVAACSRAPESAPLLKAGASLALLGLAAFGLRPKRRAAKTHVVELACCRSSTIFEPPRMVQNVAAHEEITMVTDLIDLSQSPAVESGSECAQRPEVSLNSSCIPRATPRAARCVGGHRFAGARRGRPQAHAGRSARRAVGERLMERPPPAVVPPSFDASSLRSKIQQGLRIPQSLRCGARSSHATHVCGSRTRGSIIEVEHVLQQAYDNCFGPAITKMLSCLNGFQAPCLAPCTVRRSGGDAVWPSGRGCGCGGLRSTCIQVHAPLMSRSA
ncbi:Cacna1h [Symbiodinium pilosum]|uniref:Cacna1h protein n=1 Tax=Symbiodinium pilosum TaxID=2952 RepID=A0A812JEI6_SYMPI|nr:Cacna1h [Symbiodinium pilosum]